MKITPARIILPVLCLVVGAALIYAGLAAGWGLVWVLGGEPENPFLGLAETGVDRSILPGTPLNYFYLRPRP